MIDLKRFRKDKKLRQKDVFTLLHIDQPYYSQIENYDRPLNDDKLKLLLEVFGNEILSYRIDNSCKSEILNKSEDPEAEYKKKNKKRCPECEEKQKEIDRLERENKLLEDLIESQKETIAALKGDGKKETTHGSGKKVS